MMIHDPKMTNQGSTNMATYMVLPFWRENQLVLTQKKQEGKGELKVWITKMQGNVQGKVQIQGFNLLQMSSNFFLGI
jgi:hypothetical protein